MASVEKRQHVPTQRMLEFMRRRHHSESEAGTTKLWHCTWIGCQKVFTSGPGLRYHLRTHEDNCGTYMCANCNRSFKSSNGLRYHLEKTKCESFSPPHYSSSGYSSLNEYSSSLPNDWHQNNQSTDTNGSTDQHDWLRELADIATGPHSPLLQKVPEKPEQPSERVCQLGSMLHSYARQPPSRSPSPPPTLVKCKSPSFAPLSPGRRGVSLNETPLNGMSGLCLKNDDLCTSHTKPDIVWMCFLRGSRVLVTPQQTEWHFVEEITDTKIPQLTSHDVELRLLNIEECHTTEYDMHALSLRLRFAVESETADGETCELLCECVPSHPFYIKSKGWSSFHPLTTERRFGIPCHDLEVQDVCLTPDHPEADYKMNLFTCLRSYDLTPSDSSAIFTLTCMAKQKQEQEMCMKSELPTSPTRSTGKESNLKPKRPMNAFMLFAKRCRMEYMQLYPGKDNRAISVLLGDKWKKLGAEERKMYVLEAKLLADKQKQLHPDCWKRKRSMSTGVLER